MILATDQKFKIGEQSKNILLNGQHFPDQPFVVLREVTREEWLHYHSSPKAKSCLERFEMTFTFHFYEVSVD